MSFLNLTLLAAAAATAKQPHGEWHLLVEYLQFPKEISNLQQEGQQDYLKIILFYSQKCNMFYLCKKKHCKYWFLHYFIYLFFKFRLTFIHITIFSQVTFSEAIRIPHVLFRPLNFLQPFDHIFTGDTSSTLSVLLSNIISICQMVFTPASIKPNTRFT